MLKEANNLEISDKMDVTEKKVLSNKMGICFSEVRPSRRFASLGFSSEETQATLLKINTKGICLKTEVPNEKKQEGNYQRTR